MKYLISLIVTVLLFSMFKSMLGFDYDIFALPINERKMISSLAIFFVIYSLVRWLIDKIIY